MNHPMLYYIVLPPVCFELPATPLSSPHAILTLPLLPPNHHPLPPTAPHATLSLLPMLSSPFLCYPLTTLHYPQLHPVLPYLCSVGVLTTLSYPYPRSVDEPVFYDRVSVHASVGIDPESDEEPKESLHVRIAVPAGTLLCSVVWLCAVCVTLSCIWSTVSSKCLYFSSLVQRRDF